MRHKLLIHYIGDVARNFFIDSDLPTEALLEKIFAWFNHGSGEECHMLLRDKLRSLSVNDCILLDGQWYQCRGVGWEKITEEFVVDLEFDVIHHPDFETHGGWYCLSDVMRKKHGQLM